MGIVGKCAGVWGRKGRRGKRYERCWKVCWGVGEVKGDVGKGEGSEMREEMWRSVLGPSNTLPYTSSIPLPTCQHTSPLTPYTLPHFSTPHTSMLTSPHTSLHLPPYHFPPLPLPPPTPQHTSPLNPCTLITVLITLLCDDVLCYPNKYN